MVELGAIVDFGVAKISGAQPKLESAPVGAAKEPKKYNRYLLGATVPFGNFSLLASYAYSKDKNDLDEKATQIGNRWYLRCSRSAPICILGSPASMRTTRSA